MIPTERHFASTVPLSAGLQGPQKWSIPRWSRPSAPEAAARRRAARQERPSSRAGSFEQDQVKIQRRVNSAQVVRHICDVERVTNWLSVCCFETKAIINNVVAVYRRDHSQWILPCVSENVPWAVAVEMMSRQLSSAQAGPAHCGRPELHHLNLNSLSRQVVEVRVSGGAAVYWQGTMD